MLCKPAVAIALMLLAQGALAQSEAPLPPRRPPEVPSAATAATPKPEAPPSVPFAHTPSTTAEAESCLASLKEAGFEVTVAEMPKISNELCRIETPVRLQSVPVSTKHGTTVRLLEQ